MTDRQQGPSYGFNAPKTLPWAQGHVSGSRRQTPGAGDRRPVQETAQDGAGNTGGLGGGLSQAHNHLKGGRDEPAKPLL